MPPAPASGTHLVMRAPDALGQLPKHGLDEAAERVRVDALQDFLELGHKEDLLGAVGLGPVP